MRMIMRGVKIRIAGVRRSKTPKIARIAIRLAMVKDKSRF